jgi:hypothetical protein
MIQTLLIRKLAVYVAYAAVVALLPVSAANLSGGRQPPESTFQQTPDIHSSFERFQGANASRSESACDCTDCQCTNCRCDDRWWCRGPLRRGVRAAALFLSRPWRR